MVVGVDEQVFVLVQVEQGYWVGVFYVGIGEQDWYVMCCGGKFYVGQWYGVYVGCEFQVWYWFQVQIFVGGMVEWYGMFVEKDFSYVIYFCLVVLGLLLLVFFFKFGLGFKMNVYYSSVFGWL